MSVRVVVSAMALGLLAGGAAYAGSPCNGSVAQSYQESARVIASLRPDKPGQMRVFAVDGSEFTAGQAQWLRGQLRRAERLCASTNAADQAEAERVLAGVRELITSRQRGS
jgi:hypothetical protein